MKLSTFFVLSLCVAGGFATMYNLILKETHALVANDKTLSISGCSDHCDALFEHGTDEQEEMTDFLCHHACFCTIHPLNSICQLVHNTTLVSHHGH